MILPRALILSRTLLAALALCLLALVPTAATAQSREAAQLQLQIQQLQEQIRLLTGQVEGLQFQLTQMQELIQRMGEDNEFRFQQLEGNAGVTAPPRQNEGALPEERLPADPALMTTDPTQTAAVPVEPLDPGAPMHGDIGEPMHSDLGESSDPLVGTGGVGSDTLGTLGGEDLRLGNARPLDLSLDGGAQISDGDAQAQYQAGYDAIVRGDYAFAEEQFRQFIELYPDHPNAPDAINWLGEALIQRGAFNDAALQLAEGYEKYQDSARAPDIMLKLGIALNGAGEPEVACRMFVTLEKRFPETSPAFQQRLDSEKSRAQCPA